MWINYPNELDNSCYMVEGSANICKPIIARDPLGYRKAIG
jgi:hypothetical protein